VAAPRCLHPAPCMIMSPNRTTMPNASALLRLLNEFIILLLGALLTLLAVTRGVALPSRPGAMVALGAALAYWGVRAGMRPEATVSRPLSKIRSGSLILVGILIAAIALLPLRLAGLLLGSAGVILVLRGILSAILFARASSR
jgi:hypothetical protein